MSIKSTSRRRCFIRLLEKLTVCGEKKLCLHLLVRVIILYDDACHEDVECLREFHCLGSQVINCSLCIEV